MMRDRSMRLSILTSFLLATLLVMAVFAVGTIAVSKTAQAQTGKYTIVKSYQTTNFGFVPLRHGVHNGNRGFGYVHIKAQRAKQGISWYRADRAIAYVLEYGVGGRPSGTRLPIEANYRGERWRVVLDDERAAPDGGRTGVYTAYPLR